MSKIEIDVSEETMTKINHLVNIENFLNVNIPLDRKQRSSKDFVKGCVAFHLENFDNVQTLVKMSGLDNPKKQPKYNNRFKEIAEHMNIPQSSIVKATGIRQSSISQIMNNKFESNMRLDTFLKIWVTLKCPPINKCLYRVDD